MTDSEIHLRLQTPESASIRSYLDDLDTGEADTFRAAFAYVTERGIDQLENGLPDSLGATTPEWLVSFDYGYSEPEAIRRLNERGEIRVVGVEPMRERGTLQPSTRFHPKFIWIEEGDHHHLMIGSSNLTESALTRNWESVVFLHSLAAENTSVEDVSSWWEEVWEESTPVDEDLLDWYEDLREETEIGPTEGAEDYDEREDAPDPRDASVVWGHIGYTQGGARNQMDIPTQFGRFFIEDGDEWEMNAEHDVSFKFEGQEIQEQKVKFHEGSHQTRIYLPTKTGGTRLQDLFSKDKFDEESLRYHFVVFRRVRPYHFKLNILPPEGTPEIQEMIEASQQRDQVVETDEETGRLVGWL